MIEANHRRARQNDNSFDPPMMTKNNQSSFRPVRAEFAWLPITRAEPPMVNRTARVAPFRPVRPEFAWPPMTRAEPPMVNRTARVAPFRPVRSELACPPIARAGPPMVDRTARIAPFRPRTLLGKRSADEITQEEPASTVIRPQHFGFVELLNVKDAHGGTKEGYQNLWWPCLVFDTSVMHLVLDETVKILKDERLRTEHTLRIMSCKKLGLFDARKIRIAPELHGTEKQNGTKKSIVTLLFGEKLPEGYQRSYFDNSARNQQPREGRGRRVYIAEKGSKWKEIMTDHLIPTHVKKSSLSLVHQAIQQNEKLLNHCVEMMEMNPYDKDFNANDILDESEDENGKSSSELEEMEESVELPQLDLPTEENNPSVARAAQLPLRSLPQRPQKRMEHQPRPHSSSISKVVRTLALDSAEAQDKPSEKSKKRQQGKEEKSKRFLPKLNKKRRKGTPVKPTIGDGILPPRNTTRERQKSTSKSKGGRVAKNPSTKSSNTKKGKQAPESTNSDGNRAPKKSRKEQRNKRAQSISSTTRKDGQSGETIKTVGKSISVVRNANYKDMGQSVPIPSWERVRGILVSCGYEFVSEEEDAAAVTCYCRPFGNPYKFPTAKLQEDYFADVATFRSYLCAHGFDYTGAPPPEEEQMIVNEWCRYSIASDFAKPDGSDPDFQLHHYSMPPSKCSNFIRKKLGFKYEYMGHHEGYRFPGEKKGEDLLREEDLWVRLARFGLPKECCPSDKLKDGNEALAFLLHVVATHIKKLYPIFTDRRVPLPQEEQVNASENERETNDGSSNDTKDQPSSIKAAPSDPMEMDRSCDERQKSLPSPSIPGAMDVDSATERPQREQNLGPSARPFGTSEMDIDRENDSPDNAAEQHQQTAASSKASGRGTKTSNDDKVNLLASATNQAEVEIDSLAQPRPKKIETETVEKDAFKQLQTRCAPVQPKRAEKASRLNGKVLLAQHQEKTILPSEPATCKVDSKAIARCNQAPEAVSPRDARQNLGSSFDREANRPPVPSFFSSDTESELSTSPEKTVNSTKEGAKIGLCNYHRSTHAVGSFGKDASNVPMSEINAGGNSSHSVSATTKDAKSDFQEEGRVQSWFPSKSSEDISEVILPGKTSAEKLRSCLEAMKINHDHELFLGGSLAASLDKVADFMREIIDSRGLRRGAFLHVCGGPGVGKTAGIKACVNKLKEYWSNQASKSVEKAHWDEPTFLMLKGSEFQNLAKGEAMAKTFDQNGKKIKQLRKPAILEESRKAAVILLLDEVDMLVCNQGTEEYLREVIAHAADENIMLGMVAISNSIENSDLVKLGLRGNRVVFGTYEKDDLANIIINKIGKQVVDEKVVAFLASKVSQTSGDIRSMLGLVTLAVEECQGKLSSSQQSAPLTGPIVKMPHALAATKAIQRKVNEVIDSLPQYEKYALCCGVNLAKVLMAQDINFATLHQLCTFAFGYEFQLCIEELAGILDRLQDKDLIRFSTPMEYSRISYGNAEQMTVRLDLQLDDVVRALENGLEKEDFYKRMKQRCREIAQSMSRHQRKP